MNTKRKLSALLKSKRLAAGLSQRDLSLALGYSTPQFVSNWERAVSQPPISALMTLAKILNADSHELFTLILDLAIAEATEDLKKRFKDEYEECERKGK